jgi:hypothetical protein
MEGNSEVGNDVIEEKKRSHVCCIVDGGHGFFPFGKLIDID